MFITKKIQNLETQISEQTEQLRKLKDEINTLQSYIWDVELKQKEKNRSLLVNTDNIHKTLTNYEANNDMSVLTNANDITDSQEAISDLAEMSDTNSSDITDCQEAISELMEIIEGDN